MHYLRLIRFHNLVAMALIQYLIRYSLVIPVYGKSAVLSDLYFALLVYSIVLIAAGGYVINDYFDIKVDARNKEVLIGRKIKRRKALILHLFLTVSGLGIGIYLAYNIKSVLLGAILIFSAYTLWLYSLKLKRKFLVGNLTIALLSAIFIFSIPTIELMRKTIHDTQLIVLLLIYGLFGFISSWMHEIIKDLKGYNGDKEFKIPTLATVWGIPKTKEFLKWLSMLLASMVITVAVYKFTHEIYPLSFAALFLVGPLYLMNVWIYKAKAGYEYSRIANLHKLIIFAGIISLCFFV